jgi:hypothetical protein
LAARASRSASSCGLSGAITPSPESASVAASAGTVSWTCTAASHSWRWASQCAAKVRGNRARVLREGGIAPSSSHNASAGLAGKGARAKAPWRAARGVQEPLMIPARGYGLRFL